MSAPSPITIPAIIDAVGCVLGVRPREIAYRHRDAKTAGARQVVMYLARSLTPLSTGQIALGLALSDHTSVLHGVRRVRERMAADSAFAVDVERARAMVLSLAAAGQARPGPDPVAAAERVLVGDRDHAAVRLSVDETIAMAVRLVALEELAVGTYQLLCLLQAFAADAADAAARRDAIIALGDALADELAGLGYEVTETPAPQEKTDGEAHQDRGPAAPRAAE
ncbi:hypothetical protein GJ689_23250 [Rhodoplanes serenus]|uniref:Chromosomal replication initiator DnaA C-terminal domain-containing protein n=1 Tax=Rhodoplanes serenus TaxID=200615 RepID=A0A9X4XPR1_9BRAD|nr:helix-turn-helix domain-containing protein [Rhodoplanes serenus]MTW19120.1 hypothetical protein [Rhodoplanes serenus]